MCHYVTFTSVTSVTVVVHVDCGDSVVIALLLDVKGNGIWQCWVLSVQKEQDNTDRKNIKEPNNNHTTSQHP